MLSVFLYSNLQYSDHSEENQKRNITSVLKGLYTIWYRDDYDETAYLYLSATLLYSYKVARELAAEIWIKANSINKLNNELLGKNLGKLEFSEYAPLKRFTDLVMSSMFNISIKHNENLFKLINAMICEMNETPIRGVNKLLEIFIELKHHLPNSKISPLAIKKLEQWKSSKSLKSKINSLI